MTINASQLVSQIAAWVQQIVGYALLLLIAAAVAQRYGVRVPYVPAVDHIALAYLCGAFWLFRK
jgi:hypothetical protein